MGIRLALSIALAVITIKRRIIRREVHIMRNFGSVVDVKVNLCRKDRITVQNGIANTKDASIVRENNTKYEMRHKCMFF